MDSNEKYKYINALDAAIEKFTACECLKNPKAFIYGGVDLKYAVERQVYFDYCGYEPFISAFIYQKKIIARNEIDYLLAKNLNIQIDLKNSFLQELKKKIYFLYCFFHDIKIFLINKIFVYKNVSSKVDFLLFVEQKKNIEYYSTFLKGLNGSFFFLSRRIFDFKIPEQNTLITYDIFYKVLTRKRKSNILSYFPSLLIEFDFFASLLKKKLPKIVIIPEGNSSRCELLNQACKLLGIKIVCIQYGWSPIVHVGFRNMSYTAMLVWGDGFQKILQPYNLKQKFYSVGNPNIDFIDKPSIAFKEKGFVFFLPNNRQYISVDRLITSKELEDFYCLIKWTAQNYRHKKIYIRNHPSAPLSQDEITLLSASNVYFSSLECFTLKDTLERAELAVTFHSTVILECLAFSIPVLIYNTASSYPFNPDLSSFDIIKEAFNIEEAKNIMSTGFPVNKNNNKILKEIEAFKNEYFYSGKTSPIENIAAFLNSQL